MAMRIVCGVCCSKLDTQKGGSLMARHRAAPRKASRLASKRTLDAFPDRIDLRDWPYQPTLSALPDTLGNCSEVPIILDQGNEGACTGVPLSAGGHYRA